MSGGLTEIYQEGLRIPVIRLYRKGELARDTLDLLLLNMRLPAERRGDLNAQIASCRLGIQRIEHLILRFGIRLLLDAFEQIIERSRMRIRNAIGALPDGEWSYADMMDDDGVAAQDVLIKLTIRKTGQGLVFRFHRLGSAGPGQHQFDGQRRAIVRLLRTQGVARPGYAE